MAPLFAYPLSNGAYEHQNGVYTTVGVQDLRVIDDFERGNLDPYSGDLSAWSITTNAVQGTYAVECSSNVTGIRSDPGDGLNYYPQRGDKFRYRLQFEGANRHALNFGWQDNNNFYNVIVDNDSNEVFFQEQVGGTTTPLASESGLQNLGVGWLDAVIVSWGSNGDMRVQVIDDGGTTQADISATSTEFDSGSIKLFYVSKGNTEQPIRIDNIVKSGDV